MPGQSAASSSSGEADELSAEKTARLERALTRAAKLKRELDNLTLEGEQIHRELLGLIDRVKIAKVKSYIEKQK